MVEERWGEGEVKTEGLCYVATELKHLQLVENKKLSSVFKEDTLHLQWSNYLSAALSFFQAVRFFQITSRLLWEKRSLNNTPSCKNASHKNF